VTIFDKSTEFGGMIESVIPADRQSDSLKNEIAAVFSDVPKDRMALRLGKGWTASSILMRLWARASMPPFWVWACQTRSGRR